MSEKLEMVVSQALLKKLQEMADRRGVTVEDLLLVCISEFIQKEEGGQQ